MSLQFNNTTLNNGIIQRIERKIYGDTGLGTISGNTTKLQSFTSDINNALDEVFTIIFEAGGTWQFDDSNHSDFPTITTNLVANQKDYTFTEDETGNLILEIHKVYVANDDGIYEEIYQVDAEGQPNEWVEDFEDGRNITGRPYRYNLKANGIILNPIPDYNGTNGLKVLISREGSYFTTSDTTKKAGFAGLFHEYLALKPAYDYARDNGLNNAERLKRDLDEMREAIREHYSRRSKDIAQKLTAKTINYE